MTLKHVVTGVCSASVALGIITSTLQTTYFVEDTLSKLSAIKCGASNIVGLSRQQYIDRLTWIKYLLRFDPTLLSRKSFERVSYALESLKLDDSNGKIRKQPFCVLLTGYPGSGKSNFALQLAVACLKRRYGSAVSGDIVTLNETDEYQSEFRTSHKVVIFDDLGAERMRDSKNPWRKVIDFVNNVRKTALNPNVDMKGNVYMEPDLVIITTNLNGNLGVTNWMNAPGAIFRRIKGYIFLADGFTHAREIIPQNDSSDCSGAYSKNMIIDEGIDLSDLIERSVLIENLVDRFERHMYEQTLFVENANAIFDDLQSKTVLESFLHDVIYPHWPKKPILDNSTKKSLPLYTKMWHKLCLEDKQALVCMNKS